MPSIVDIHPHVIATDNTRYPLNPLGGVQSTWSRDRPTPFEALVAAMDKAGVESSLFVPVGTPREAVERALAYATKAMDAEKPGPALAK